MDCYIAQVINRRIIKLKREVIIFINESRVILFDKIVSGIVISGNGRSQITALKTIVVLIICKIFKCIVACDVADRLIVVCDKAGNDGQNCAKPSGVYFSEKGKKIAPFSVKSEQWGIFLREILDLWLKYDVGKKHVQLIDAALENLKGVPCSLCVHSPLCGHSGCVEANGDLYSCDRYVFHSYYLGNILDTELEKLMALNKEFGFHKIYGLNGECFECQYMKFCIGGCPKDRIYGKNYLCEGYKLFFAAVKDKFSKIFTQKYCKLDTSN